MSRWERIRTPEMPEHVEFHTEQMSFCYGRIMLKVWEQADGHFMASATKPNGDRIVKGLKSEDIEGAKEESIDWIRFDL